jgi:hypothetical protein
LRRARNSLALAGLGCCVAGLFALDVRLGALALVGGAFGALVCLAFRVL